MVLMFVYNCFSVCCPPSVINDYMKKTRETDSKE